MGFQSAWIVTDTNGVILGLPPHFSDVNFDDAGTGVCYIWLLSFEGDLQGDTVGGNANDIIGCHALSNPITVERSDTSESCPIINVTVNAIINEITGTGNVELKNIGSDSIDVSSFYLCNFPAYILIDTLTVICGSLKIAPGEFVTIDASSLGLSSSDGELGLYSDDSFSSSSSILDYVEWGSSGHQRASVAINAGIWSQGDMATAFAADMSLLYDGNGDAGSDWAEGAINECDENNIIGIQSNEEPLFSFKISPNPVFGEASLKFYNKSGTSRGLMYIYDQTGSIRMNEVIFVEDGYERRLDFSHLERGIYFIKIFSSDQSYYSKFIVH